MLELAFIYLFRKANRIARDAQVLASAPAQHAQPVVEAEREVWPPCTREGCKLKFNHGHI
jgi:hypothetical protein